LAAAAVYFHPQKNNLVIGLGSCITYNFINKYNQFIGGSISPGMEMRFKSLQTFTAKLPLIKADWNFPLIGYDTKTNILSGVILGMAKEIDGIIDAYAEKFNNFNVLLTGGDAPYFARHLKSKIFADPHLIFKGLYAISEYNDDTKT
jgi:type III pantothenate kinase